MKASHLFAALATALLGAAMAGAQGPGGPGGMGPGGMGPGFGQHRPPMERAMVPEGNEGRWWDNPHIAEQLKLTDEQRKAMDQILYDHRAKLIDLRADLEKAELAMQPLMSADQPDRAAMEAQIDKIVQSRAALEHANSMFLLDIRMKLSPDQWKMLHELHAMHEHMRDHGMGRMHEGGPDQQRRWHRGPDDGQGGPGAGQNASPGAPPPAQGGEQQPPAGGSAPPPQQQ